MDSQAVQDVRQRMATDGTLGHGSYRFMRGIVHDRQSFDDVPSAVDCPVSIRHSGPMIGLLG